MSPKIDPQLLSHLRELEARQPGQRAGALVTMADEADLSAIDPESLDIGHVFESINVFSARLSLCEAERLAARDDVVRIEADGEMHALD